MRYSAVIRRFMMLTISLSASAVVCSAQIVNHLGVEQPFFLKYAAGKMQRYDMSNIALADSLYKVGESMDDVKMMTLALDLEMPAQFAAGNYDRMIEIVSSLKGLSASYPVVNRVYYSSIYDFCQFQVYLNRTTSALIEAREMSRKASSERSQYGALYSYKILGIIQRSRSNSQQAIDYFLKAMDKCNEIAAEQEIPELYTLIAREYVKTGDFDQAEKYCALAEKYVDFYPATRVLTMMSRLGIHEAKGERLEYLQTYDNLRKDPFYVGILDNHTRSALEIGYLKSFGRYSEAMKIAESIDVKVDRLHEVYGVYLSWNDYPNALFTLQDYVQARDSVFLMAQNEDLAVLDAELNNAQLRLEAERLKWRNQIIVMVSFIILFLVFFFGFLLSQWSLKNNLDKMIEKTRESLDNRAEYRSGMDSVYQQNEMKTKIILRLTNPK